MVDEPFVETASIKAPPSAPVARPVGDILGDVLNVKSFGATGNGVDDDTVALQRCFDTAFGGPASELIPVDSSEAEPHAVANAWKNRAVFLPTGKYVTDGSLYLKDVYGAHIFGGGIGSCEITFPSGPTVVGLHIDGLKKCHFRDWSVIPTNESLAMDGLGVDLDCTDGASPVGLGDNIFTDWGSGGAVTENTQTVSGVSGANFTCTGHGFAAERIVRFSTSGTLPAGLTSGYYFVLAAGLTANVFRVSTTINGTTVTTSSGGSGTLSVHAGTGMGMRVGHSGIGGDGNTFFRCGWGAGDVAVLVEHGIGNTFEGGASGARVCFKCTGGSIHCHMHALDDASIIGHYISTLDPCSVIGCRSEAHASLVYASGPGTGTGSRVFISAISVTGTPTTFLTMRNNANVILESSYSQGNISVTAGCNLYVRNVSFPTMGAPGSAAWTALGAGGLNVLRQGPI